MLPKFYIAATGWYCDISAFNQNICVCSYQCAMHIDFSKPNILSVRLSYPCLALGYHIIIMQSIYI